MGRTGGGAFGSTKSGRAAGIGEYTSTNIGAGRAVVSIASGGSLTQSQRTRLDNDFGLLASTRPDGTLQLSGSRYHPEGKQGFTTSEILKRYRAFKRS